jgi:hypothetical protein
MARVRSSGSATMLMRHPAPPATCGHHRTPELTAGGDPGFGDGRPPSLVRSSAMARSRRAYTVARLGRPAGRHRLTHRVRRAGLRSPSTSSTRSRSSVCTWRSPSRSGCAGGPEIRSRPGPGRSQQVQVDEPRRGDRDRGHLGVRQPAVHPDGHPLHRGLLPEVRELRAEPHHRLADRAWIGWHVPAKKWFTGPRHTNRPAGEHGR